jgi:hypothetical protein
MPVVIKAQKALADQYGGKCGTFVSCNFQKKKVHMSPSVIGVPAALVLMHDRTFPRKITEET